MKTPPEIKLFKIFNWQFIVILSAFVIFFIIHTFSVFDPITESLAFDIVEGVCFSFLILYFTFIHISKPPIAMRIAILPSICTLWLNLIIDSSRIILLIVSLTLYELLIVSLFFYFKKMSIYPMSAVLLFILSLSILFASSEYSFVNSPNGIHYWQFSLVVSFVALVVCIILLVKDLIKLKNDRLSEKICLPILVFLFVFVLCSSSASNANYIFDTSQKIEYTLPISSKNADTSGRMPTEYIFVFEINSNTVEVEVPESIYRDHEIGDEVTIHLYQGFFNDPYYIFE